MLSRYMMYQVKHNSYFVAGVALGLWVALATVPLDDGLEACGPAGPGGPASVGAPDEFEPAHVARAPAASGRAVTRPRYYSTELGMRAPILVAILSTEDQLDGRVSALNATLGALGGALRFFIAASGPAATAARPNVIGFTDTREMLRPFHALKYLADNYLEDYELFLLSTDSAWLNARRVRELAGSVSAARKLYLGTRAPGQPYCLLDAGIVLSRATLAAVQGSLDWCVRNSYSAHHHENLGRCVMHAAQVQCTSEIQGMSLESVELPGGAASASASASGALRPRLADALSARPLTDPADLYRLQAYVSRVYLERDQSEIRRLSGAVSRLTARHPRGYRNASWPRGLRDDPGMAAPTPNSRFDSWRWTWFNSSHALLPDDHSAAAPLTGAHKQAVQWVVSAALSWCGARWGAGEGAGEGALLEGAWRWQPAHGLSYRMLFALTAQDGATLVRGVEVWRPLGAARLVPVPYVTESARVTLLYAVTASPRMVSDVTAALAHYEEACFKRQHNTNLVVVWVWSAAEARDRDSDSDSPAARALRSRVAALRGRWASQPCRPPPHNATLYTYGGRVRWAQQCAVRAAAAGGLLPPSALVLALHPAAQYNDDFLNRVRMNTIEGVSWYAPAPFARFALFAHPRFVDAAGNKPTTGTGRFGLTYHTVAFYRSDYDKAVSGWRSAEEPQSLAEALSGGGGGGGAGGRNARAVAAPEPALVLRPPPPPCALTQTAASASDAARCVGAHLDLGAQFAELPLGPRAALADLILDTPAAA